MHTSKGTAHTDMAALTRLGGHTPQQTAELLDRLVALHALTAWHHDRASNEVFWRLPSHDHRTGGMAGLTASSGARQTYVS
ncbi:hypothetical protein [Streptomyces cyanogenus]|uniref:hypothetical protein n=1 Tax=Streptomyces cyanogenus TaxID=80860 RepID=UPI001FB603A3|nr:hypothetical protein [Streptomyces cyanogenus]